MPNPRDLTRAKVRRILNCRDSTGATSLGYLKCTPKTGKSVMVLSESYLTPTLCASPPAPYPQRVAQTTLPSGLPTPPGRYRVAGFEGLEGIDTSLHSDERPLGRSHRAQILRLTCTYKDNCTVADTWCGRRRAACSPSPYLWWRAITWI